MKRKQTNTDNLQMDLFADEATEQADLSKSPEKEPSELNTPPASQSNQMEECMAIEPEVQSHGIPSDTKDSFYVGTNGNRFTVTYLDYLPNGVCEKIDACDVIQRALKPWHNDGNNK